MTGRGDKVLDSVVLESLAVIAAAHDRSVIEELNRAVAMYVLQEIRSNNDLSCLEESLLGKVSADQR